MPRKAKPTNVSALDSWTGLMSYLSTTRNLQDVKALMDYELSNKSRLSFLSRLHTRFCRLRQVDEWQTIENKVKNSGKADSSH